MSEEELKKVVDRGITLTRIFNLREGLTSAEDKLPERFTTTPSEGALQGIDPVKFDIVQKAYYKMLGWDKNGVPTRQKLKDLDIMWAGKQRGHPLNRLIYDMDVFDHFLPQNGSEPGKRILIRGSHDSYDWRQSHR